MPAVMVAHVAGTWMVYGDVRDHVPAGMSNVDVEAAVLGRLDVDPTVVAGESVPRSLLITTCTEGNARLVAQVVRSVLDGLSERPTMAGREVSYA